MNTGLKQLLSFLSPWIQRYTKHGLQTDCLYCERSEQPLAKGEGPGQIDTNSSCEHENVKECLNCHIFLASPVLFLQKSEVV